MERFAGKRAKIGFPAWIVFDPTAPKDAGYALGPICTSDVLFYSFENIGRRICITTSTWCCREEEYYLPAIAGDGITDIGVSGLFENTLYETDTMWNILGHTFLYAIKELIG